MSYITAHSVFEDNECILDKSRVDNPYQLPICFANYNSETRFYNLKDNRRIEIYVYKDYSSFNCLGFTEMIFNLKQIKLYLKDLNRCGFKFYLKERTDMYVITAYEKDFYNKTHLKIALDFVRCLWEKTNNKILLKYFELDRKYILNKHPFVVLNVLNHIVFKTGYHNGHAIPSSCKGPHSVLYLCNFEEFNEKIQNKMHCFSGQSGQSFFENQIGYDRKYSDKVIKSVKKALEKKKVQKNVVKDVKVAVAV